MHFKPMIAAFGRRFPLPDNSGGYLENPYGPLEAQLKNSGLSPEAVSTVMFHNLSFLRFLKEKLGFPSEEEVSQYLTFLQENQSPQTATLASAALRFFFQRVLGEDKQLPLLATGEAERLISAATSLPDKILLELLYHCGLRLSEAVQIQLQDIDLKSQKLSVGEGGDRRTVPLPPTVCRHLAFSLRLRRQDGDTSLTYLFSSSARASSPLSLTAAQKIIETAARRAGIELRSADLSTTLRTSAAAHLLQQGADLEEIRQQFGSSPTGLQTGR